MHNLLAWISDSSLKLLKGALLLLWIYVLSLTTMYAASRSVSSLVFDFFGRGGLVYFSGFERADSPFSRTDELRRYLYQRYDETPAPIESVLDTLLVSPGWIDRELKTDLQGEEKKQWLRDQYRRLFSRIDQRLLAIASDKSVDPRTVKFRFSDIVSDKFAQSEEEKKLETTLPSEAVNWIVTHREDAVKRKERGSLIDTFAILMALGAFGSLIFLTRDFVFSPEAVSLESYVFRPVLGMFLAVAVFVIDIAAHTIVSNSDILSVRHETLYLLAFAAGLLSEQAYSIVGRRAASALKKAAESEGSNPP